MTVQALKDQLRAKALLTVRAYGDGLSYDEAVGLGEMNREQLRHLSPFDPAYQFLVRGMRTYYQVAEALNLVHELDRHDHTFEVPVIYSYRKGVVTEETVVRVRKDFRDKQIATAPVIEACRLQLRLAGVYLKALEDLEVVVI